MRQIENITLMGDGKASIFLQPRGSQMVRTLCLEVEETRPHMLQRKVLARRNNCMTLPVERRQRASHLLFDLSSSAQLEIIKSVNRIQQDESNYCK